MELVDASGWGDGIGRHAGLKTLPPSGVRVRLLSGPPERRKKMQRAEEIEQRACFRKKGAEYAYLRISDSAAKFHGLDFENKV